MRKYNLTKIGVSALCGSLAAIASAQAGSMSVSGGATTTWTKGSQGTNGNPIGMNSGMTFVGKGELDGGTAVTYTLTHADKAAYSVGSISLATPSLGTFGISHASGGQGLGGYDDKMPTAWEETWGGSLGTSVNMVKGVGSSSNIQWASPSFGGTTLKIAYAPRNDGATANDKATGGHVLAGTHEDGVDVVVDLKPIDGVNIWLGGSKTNRAKLRPTKLEERNARHEANVGGVFTFGPLSLGAAKTYEVTGNQGAGDVDYYVTTMFGVAFNVNDNLSVSYGRFEQDKRLNEPSGNNADITLDSYQVAYTLGGASFKFARFNGDNVGFSTAASADKDTTTLAMTLAF